MKLIKNLQLQRAYLEGRGDLVSMVTMGITGLTIGVIMVINLLTKSPDPPSWLEDELVGFRVRRVSGLQGLRC